MKITHQDLKTGTVTVVPESVDDLWALSQVLDAGDEVSGKTVRKIKLEGERKSEVIKKTIFLRLNAEKFDFDANGELRVSGKILEGPEDVARGSYHTFSVESGTAVTIVKKRWFSFQLQRLKEASEAKPPSILICAFDREDAIFAKLTKAGYETILKLRGDVQRKRMETKAGKNFFEEIVEHLREYATRLSAEKIILASPAFWKDELLKSLKDAALKKKVVLATISSADESGIAEALKRPELQEALRQERAAKEINLVEQVLAGIAKGSAVSYGLAEVTAAAEAGAVTTLLVTDTLITRSRSDGTFSAVERVLQSVDDAQGAIVIVSGKHEGGRKLDGLGGIAALLRYRLG
jgi:protein pelota